MHPLLTLIVRKHVHGADPNGGLRNGQLSHCLGLKWVHVAAAIAVCSGCRGQLLKMLFLTSEFSWATSMQ